MPVYLSLLLCTLGAAGSPPGTLGADAGVCLVLLVLQFLVGCLVLLACLVLLVVSLLLMVTGGDCLWLLGLMPIAVPSPSMMFPRRSSCTICVCVCIGCFRDCAMMSRDSLILLEVDIVGIGYCGKNSAVSVTWMPLVVGS